MNHLKHILFAAFLILPFLTVAQSKLSYHTITPKDIHSEIEH